MLGEHDDLLALVPRFGCDPLEQNYNFAEICHRSRKRWDMRVPGEAVSALTSAAVQASLPVILGLDRLPLHPDEGRLPLARRLPAGKPRTLMTGAIVSQPGARAQRFHTDADGGHLNWAGALPLSLSLSPSLSLSLGLSLSLSLSLSPSLTPSLTLTLT